MKTYTVELTEDQVYTAMYALSIAPEHSHEHDRLDIAGIMDKLSLIAKQIDQDILKDLINE